MYPRGLIIKLHSACSLNISQSEDFCCASIIEFKKHTKKNCKTFRKMLIRGRRFETLECRITTTQEQSHSFKLKGLMDSSNQTIPLCFSNHPSDMKNSFTISTTRPSRLKDVGTCLAVSPLECNF